MTKEKEIKFEEKLKKLESIVNELESGEIDLDESIDDLLSEVYALERGMEYDL